MAPGPKKKGGQYPNQNRFNPHKAAYAAKLEGKPHHSINPEKPVETAENEATNSKYKKGVIESNWSRYDEPPKDVNEDVKKGSDYEVLMSFSSGAGSQLQLKDEKDWVDENQSFSLDLKYLCKAYKSVAFPDRLHIPEEYFDRDQLLRFRKCADANRKLYFSTDSEQVQKKPGILTVQGMDCVIGESEEDLLEFAEKSDIVKEAEVLLPTKTECLIQSLASCLSQKDVNELPSDFKPSDEPPIKDDLDFLLNLSSRPEPSTDVDDNTEKKLSVDEWLDNILSG